MKKLLVLVFGLLIGVVNLFAQANDTLFVPVLDPNQGQFLNQTIANDNQAHAVYKLTKGQTYFIDGPITSVNFHLNIVGEPASIRGEQPATIRPFVLQDGTIPLWIIDASGDLTLKNVNLFSVGPLGQTQQYVVRVRTDLARITVDNCIFEGNNEFGIEINGVNTDIFVSNSIFRNNQNLTQYYNGRSIWSFQPVDTVEIVNSTFVNSGAYCFTETNHSAQFYRFEHNTVVNILNTPFFLHQQTNAVISHNLFFNADFLGQSNLEYLGGWDDSDLQLSAIISFDTLNATVDDIMDAVVGGDFTEADRRITVRNNAYFWEQEFIDFWDSADSLHGPVWINARTQALFADDASYPLLVEANNLNVAATFTQSPGTKDKQLTQINALRQPGGPDPLYWGIGADQTVQTFPLSENLAFSDATLLTLSDGGFPVGDLNWFGLVDEWIDFITAVEDDDPVQLPQRFVLHQNYPNPFNPTTLITYQISQSSDVKLAIYNLRGQFIRNLINNERKDVGTYSVAWDGRDQFGRAVASGVYLYKMAAGGLTQTKKMLLMK